MSEYHISIGMSAPVHAMMARARSLYGVAAQRLKLAEECAELAAALVREAQGTPQPEGAVAGEMADVLILILQAIEADDYLSADVHRALSVKMERFDERMAERLRARGEV